jgi:hypothetical protein
MEHGTGQNEANEEPFTCSISRGAMDIEFKGLVLV